MRIDRPGPRAISLCQRQGYIYCAMSPLPASAGSTRLAPAPRVMISHKGPHRMPLYENVFIARQDISGAQVDTLADTFTQLVADNGGEVKKREYWGLRNLAYRMRKNRKGHYVLLNIAAPPAAVAELERTMRIDEDVIRYLTIRVDSLEEGPSAVMQSRGGRDDRQRRGSGDRERFGEARQAEAERPATAESAVPEAVEV